MKKTVKGVLLLTTAVTMATGCSKIGMGEDVESTKNSVYVTDDDSVRQASVGTYQQGDYMKDELKTRVGQKVGDFNSRPGKAASYENSEGSRKFPVAMVSVRIGNGTVTLVTECDTPGRLVGFAQEIEDHNVSFTQLDTGRVVAISNELEDTFSKDEKRKVVNQETVPKKGQNLVVKATGRDVIVTEKKIQYTGDDYVLKGSKRAQTSNEGTSHIMLK